MAQGSSSNEFLPRGVIALSTESQLSKCPIGLKVVDHKNDPNYRPLTLCVFNWPATQDTREEILALRVKIVGDEHQIECHLRRNLKRGPIVGVIVIAILIVKVLNSLLKYRRIDGWQVNHPFLHFFRALW
eukprot:CAMPEP_0174288872 /NCGR_PEP_ID=MMETSP0809-20121228/22571_1 /TAXON_ID=73025 ORGANISM="Eutreptiella gymnastica-like, Strain CCMP1594" /NCGR_SAMPLE_ID=MMETSP0809 /ASSEMBLY_ACC=CAM_ASM_000658 /LENGTH=129 /DNA_ID=CAMNT_0015386403 /DNA_START=774 /DNA_END=1163 /DNA_ORIENTATION=+